MRNVWMHHETEDNACRCSLPDREMVKMTKYMSIEDRFYQKVQKTESCWLWKGALTSRGYGSLGDGAGKKISAHRYSYILHRGEIPEGLIVCHTCDVRECVNPDHLWVGTYKDNVNDMFAKNRQGWTSRRSPFCRRGHEFAVVGFRKHIKANGIIDRSCNECKKIRDKQRLEDPAKREQNRQYMAEYYKKNRDKSKEKTRLKYLAKKNQGLESR